MSRFITAALAAITAALGLLMENVWLLAAAGGFFLLALIVLAFLAFRRRSRRAEQQAARIRTREDELRELGISDVRPKAGSQPPVSAPVSSPPRPSETAAAVEEPATEVAPEAVEPLADTEEMAGGAAATPETGPLPERHPELPRDDNRAVLEAEDDHPLWQTHSPTAFASFLRACWAATEVQTALVATAEADGSHTMVSVRSHSPLVRKEGRLPADSFLNVAPAERPITILEPNDPVVRDLPYYSRQMNVGGVAVLPVKSSAGLVYLVVDLQPDQPGFTTRQRNLLLGFADLLRTLLDHPLEEPPTRGVPTRRSIIGEEMERARSESRPLALALVYRTDAEAIANRGAAAVAEAERDLRLLLEDLVHHGRLERFGELMFGAFLHEEKAALQEWADRVQERGDEDGFDLAIGVARMGNHRDADDLRADAANALAEALQTRDRQAFARPRLQ